ncbi:MAG: hypothetical protein FJZ57_07305 [Chlamydiae bacterium]|nr:hypothetical protein [Chlamydiota bacterium]
MSLHVNTSCASPAYDRYRLSPGASSEEEDDEAIDLLREKYLGVRSREEVDCFAVVSTTNPLNKRVRLSTRFHIVDTYQERGFTYFSFKPDDVSVGPCFFQHNPRVGEVSRLKIIVRQNESDVVFKRILMSNNLWRETEGGGALSINGRAHVIVRPLAAEEALRVLAPGRSFSREDASPDPEVMQYMLPVDQTTHMLSKIDEIKLRCAFDN